MIARLLNGETQSITSAALLIGAASFVSRFIGIFRDRILAGEFGAGTALDIYYAAFRIPDFMFQLLVVGAISAGFIPLFARALHHDPARTEAWALANTILTTLLVFLGAVSLFIFFLLPFVIHWFVPGFSLAAQHETIVLTRIMLLGPLFLGISSIFGGMLQTFRYFFVNALAPIFYNVGIIIGALFFVPSWGIHGLAWGVVLGAILHASIQLPSLWSMGFRLRFAWDVRSRALHALAKIMAPRTFALGMMQLNIFVLTIIASGLRAGGLTIFHFANNIQYVPIGLFGVTYAIAAFPTLTQHCAEGARKEFVRVFSRTARQMFFFLIPSTILLIGLRAQVVRALLGAGAFNWEDTVRTMDALTAFSFGMIAQALLYLLYRAFWADGDARTPAIVTTIGVALNIVLAFFLKERLGVEGLAYAVSIASVFQGVTLWLLLRRRFGCLDEARIGRAVWSMSVAAVGMIPMIQLTKYMIEPVAGTETLGGIIFQGGVATLLALGVYLAILWVYGSLELRSFVHGIRRRITPRAEQLELFEQ